MLSSHKKLYFILVNLVMLGWVEYIQFCLGSGKSHFWAHLGLRKDRKHYKEFWILIWLCFIWSIWLHRNQIQFCPTEFGWSGWNGQRWEAGASCEIPAWVIMNGGLVPFLAYLFIALHVSSAGFSLLYQGKMCIFSYNMAGLLFFLVIWQG